jgi:hypothetical protein
VKFYHREEGRRASLMTELSNDFLERLKALDSKWATKSQQLQLDQQHRKLVETCSCGSPKPMLACSNCCKTLPEKAIATGGLCTQTIIAYCSSDCQMRDWPRHKKECGKFTPCPDLFYVVAKLGNNRIIDYAQYVEITFFSEPADNALFNFDVLQWPCVSNEPLFSFDYLILAVPLKCRQQMLEAATSFNLKAMFCTPTCVDRITNTTYDFPLVWKKNICTLL